MKKLSKVLIIAASLSLALVFVFPMWEISLEAPQYPEGLAMQIWANKITGDLNTINGLNHYIGMKQIKPDSIKELTIMPFIIGFLLVTGIGVGLAGKKKLLAVWTILFVLAGVAGGVDFYMWEYDYGHNLNPEAAIKVPGMSYQPPIIGSKQLLNFTATSMPDIGGFALIGAGLTAILVLLYEWRFNKSFGKVKNEKENAKHTDNDSSVHHALMQH
jgi:copper chaperone NosL